MELDLKFFATFREAVGSKTISLEFDDGIEVEDVLQSLESDYAELKGNLMEDGDLAPQISVLKNGNEVLHLDGIATPLEGGDTLAIFPPVAGGHV
ncbi:MAG: MoaD family protein, archaeal [Halorubrum sp. J07HR59]|nr:MAG: MoaD family protein, archaeal [Halorubrum sp. J07HR59]